jgi:hypothetical protein
MEDRVSRIEEEKNRLAWENNELGDDILEMRCHYMKYNLVFAGIPEPSNIKEENTEEVVKTFIGRKLEIYPTTIPFQNVHRLRKRPDGKPRSIVARFTRFDDHEKVRRAASEKLKNKAHVSVYQQYPMEISVRRKQLLPRLNDALKNGDRARLLNDKLFINGRPPPPGPPVEIRFNDRPRPQYHHCLKNPHRDQDRETTTGAVMIPVY